MGCRSDWANQHAPCKRDLRLFSVLELPVSSDTASANSQSDFSRSVIRGFSAIFRKFAIVWQTLNSANQWHTVLTSDILC